VSKIRASVHREVEVKLRVTRDFDLTMFLQDVPGVTLVGPNTVHMNAAYYDTRELTLLRWGITVRRREGGADAGWHMKLPVTNGKDGARDELHLPLTDNALGDVPAEFIEMIAPLLRNKTMGHLADVKTTRTTYTMIDEHGHSVVEIADDHVIVEQDKIEINAFREIEVELLHDTKSAMDVLVIIQKRILDTGATPISLSKVASALGPLASAPPDVPHLGAPERNCLAVDLIRHVIAEHTRQLLLADVGIRRGLPDSIHQMRVAARRLRSTLSAFEGLVDADQARLLRAELAWIARELGAVRDLEVLLDRLVRQAAELSDPSDADVAASVVRSALERRLEAAQSSALLALRSARHFDLVEDLIAASAQPPVTDAAREPARELLTPMVKRTWKKLANDVRALSFTSPSTQWHQARIRAKRARYTADSATTISGKDMRAYAQKLANITDILGDLHDAHVAELFLRELAAAPHVSGREGLALGRLLDLQHQHDLAQRSAFTKAWPATRSAARGVGLR